MMHTALCTHFLMTNHITDHLKYKESLRWNVAKTSFEVIQNQQEQSCSLNATGFRGFLKITSSPPRNWADDHGTYTVTISSTVKRVSAQANPASLDAIFSLHMALEDLSKRNDGLQPPLYYQAQYASNVNRGGTDSFLYPPSTSVKSGSSSKQTAVDSDFKARSNNLFRALRYVNPGSDANNNPYHATNNVNVSGGPQQRWLTKINSHIKFGDIRASIRTPECADLDVQIMKLSMVTNRSILPPAPVPQGPPQHRGHTRSQNSSGSSLNSAREDYLHFLVNIWKMDARLMLAVDFDDSLTSGMQHNLHLFTHYKFKMHNAIN